MTMEVCSYEFGGKWRLRITRGRYVRHGEENRVLVDRRRRRRWAGRIMENKRYGNTG